MSLISFKEEEEETRPINHEWIWKKNIACVVGQVALSYAISVHKIYIKHSVHQQFRGGWCESFLLQGTDTSTFTDHSTRAAFVSNVTATSVPTKVIL